MVVGWVGQIHRNVRPRRVLVCTHESTQVHPHLYCIHPCAYTPGKEKKQGQGKGDIKVCGMVPECPSHCLPATMIAKTRCQYIMNFDLRAFHRAQ